MEFRFTEMSILPISLMIIFNGFNLYTVTGLSEHHHHLTTNVKMSSKSMKPKCDISRNPKCINPLEFSLDNNIDGWKSTYESANKKLGIECVNKDRTLCVPKHEVFKNNKLVNPLEFNLEGNHDNLKNSHSFLDNNCIYCQNYIKRFINLFLRSSGLKNYKLYKGAKKQVTFEYIINSSELDILQKFVENGGNNFAAVNEVLERILFPSEGTTFYEDFFFFGYSSIINKLSFINNSPEWLIVISVAVVGFSTYCIIFSSGGYYRAFINIIILILFAGYGFTWLRMYQINVYIEETRGIHPGHYRHPQFYSYFVFSPR
uniref:Chloride channel CLIC-like protein 1 n=1 Tax=Clastoptera arizonana TaxID=38151 RepID=A0A1B6CYY6_9HEMI